MSVYKHRNSKHWQFDFQLKGYRFSGSTEVPATRPKAEARAVEEEERRAAQQLVGEIASTGRRPVTFGAVADRWWSEHGQYLRTQDIRDDVEWLKQKIGPATRLHEITNDTIARLVNERRQHRVRAGFDEKGAQLWRPVSPRTVNGTVTFLLRRIMRRARRNWNAVILREPDWTSHILKVNKRPIRPITHAEERAIEAVEDPDHGKLRRFAFITGLRRGELLLTWPQVDFEAGTVAIIGKGGIPAIVPLSREAYGILWAERGRHPKFVFTFVAKRTRTCPKTGREYVRGQRYPITYSGIGSHKRHKWAAAGVDARFHDARHTAGTRILRATGNLKLAQRLLRHTDIKTTADFYAEALLDDVRAGMEVAAKADRHHADQAARESDGRHSDFGISSGTLGPVKSP